MSRKPDDLIIPRPSLTKTNAERFVEIFDSLIDNWGQDIILDPSILDIAFTTYRQRISEALLWLTMYPLGGKSKKTTDDYSKLRGSIKFSPILHQGQWMVSAKFKFNFKRLTSFDAQIPVDAVEAATLHRGSWREKILDFLKDPSQSVLVLTGAKEIGCFLTPSDIKWIEDTFSGADIVFEIKSDLIKAAK